MHIRDIIGFKDRDVATIGPDALVVEAADIMWTSAKLASSSCVRKRGA